MATTRKSRRRKAVWGRNNQNTALAVETATGALADQTVLAAPLSSVSDEEYRAISLKLWLSIRAHTAGEGPILVGVAHNDYSVTEIKQYIEATATMTRNNMIAAEQANRFIRRLGVFAGDAVTETLNDGNPIHVKLNWHVVDGTALQIWAYNQSGATLTTGTVVVTQGSLFLRWGQ